MSRIFCGTRACLSKVLLTVGGADHRLYWTLPGLVRADRLSEGSGQKRPMAWAS